jgi:hypothetical protein
VVVSAARIGEPIWAECTPDERGLWMVNQLCDLVQLRTLPAGRWCGCTRTCADSTATPPHVGGVAGGVACYWASTGRTLAAWGPLGPWATSNSTVWPSFSER